MPTSNDFFVSPSEQSLAKAAIVSSYFSSWANVIKSKWLPPTPIGYIDLFCGPGKYQDGTESVPIKIVRSVLADDKLSSRMIIAFNDENPNNIQSLKQAIAEIDANGVLKNRIQYSKITVDDSFYKRIWDNNIPILSFVDPFGYKGLTRTLIQTLIRNNGSDCIFFFNYSRINMALSSNNKFDSYLAGIFGAERAETLKQELSPLSPESREPVVINALIEALKEINDVSVLPFKFYRTDMHRTSHFIIFVSKHTLACRIMKETMAKISSKDGDGVALFEFHDRANFGEDAQQMSFLDTPFMTLCDELRKQNAGKSVLVKDICDKYANSYENPFVVRNIKDALIRLEEGGEVSVTGRKRQPAKGKKTMPDGALVTFK